MEKLASGNANLVTENIVSAHISNICLLIGGLMFVIVDRLMSARLMMTQLMKQSSSSLALSLSALSNDRLMSLFLSPKLEFIVPQSYMQNNAAPAGAWLQVVQMHWRLDTDFQGGAGSSKFSSKI